METTNELRLKETLQKRQSKLIRILSGILRGDFLETAQSLVQQYTVPMYYVVCRYNVNFLTCMLMWGLLNLNFNLETAKPCMVHCSMCKYKQVLRSVLAVSFITDLSLLQWYTEVLKHH